MSACDKKMLHTIGMQGCILRVVPSLQQQQSLTDL